MKYKLLKDIGIYEKGIILDSFNGLLQGLYSVSFLDTNFFQDMNPSVPRHNILPKKNIIDKWCISRIPETADEINIWFNKKFKGYTYSAKNDYWIGISRWNYLHFPMHESPKKLYDHIIEGYTEITFDEFKKYILSSPTLLKSKKKLVKNTF